jgi:hypothetical protein
MRLTFPLCAVLALLLSACAEEPAPQPATPQTQPDPNASSAAPELGPGLAAATDPGAAASDPQEVAFQARLSEAQSYLGAATDSARKRYEESLQACRKLQAADRADCETSAIASEEAELRAARVEFDRRMSEGQ